MFNQHAKWLQASAEVSWRRPIASFNYLLSSHVWRQDHNGFTHQDPGFLDVVLNKDPEIVRVYLPPDANTLLSTYDHCLRSRHYVNVVVAGKQPQEDWLSVHRRRAALHPRARHLGVGGKPRRGRHGARRRAGLRRGDSHTGDAGRRRDPPRAAAGPARTGRQRRRPHAAAAGVGAPARPARPRVRHRLHRDPAGDLRLSRLSVAGAPAQLPAPQPRPDRTSAATRSAERPPPRSTW